MEDTKKKFRNHGLVVVKKIMVAVKKTTLAVFCHLKTKGGEKYSKITTKSHCKFHHENKQDLKINPYPHLIPDLMPIIQNATTS